MLTGPGAAAANFKYCSLIVAVNITPQQCRNGNAGHYRLPKVVSDRIGHANVGFFLQT
jgi:hypothetical protein